MDGIQSVSMLNVNGHQFAIKDSELTTVVDLIIDAIGNNNDSIGSRINNLNDRVETLENTGGNFTETDPIYSASAAAGIASSDISNWNGKYTKPSTGIPKTDLASGVQTSLGKADTALQSYTETDPIYSASAAAGITSSDITNWNGKYTKPSTGIPKTDLASGVQTSLGKADTALQSYTETDPTVPSWAKQPNKPTYTASEVGAATTAGVQAEIAALVDSAPETLNTLNELATALGNDANFATTVANQIGSKYTKPSNGIPKTDLASGVQTSLGKADTALQSYTETDPIYSASAAAGITSSDITNWNGKYTKPSTGIPKTDLASGVQTSLGKADTALQSFTETDPIYSASAAAGITSSDISNWNSKTSNTGTITGITMNNTSKGTSGVVDLGTVITSHQSIKTVNNESLVGTGNIVIPGLPQVSSADNGKILMVVNGAWQLVSPVTLYSGSGTPANSQGNNGDLYIQS